MNKPTIKNSDSPESMNQPDVATPDEDGDDAVIGVALRWSLAVFVAVAVIAAIGAAAWFLRPRPTPVVIVRKYVPSRVRAKTEVKLPRVLFTDITASAGINFVHVNGAYGQKYLPETMGSGAAFFDYDNDGDADLLLINSNYWPGHAPPGKPAPTMALYQNDGGGNFVDVTKQAGLATPLYGMGAAVGDYDNDGWRDLFISAVGHDRLFHNEQGKFVDVTAESGVAGAEEAWGVSSGWFDYNNDGLLDLFVCNYVKWSREYDASQGFQLVGGGRAYGRPDSFEGVFPYLYRNDGGGRFSDVSSVMGVQTKNPATGAPMAKALGLAFIDIDDDGYLDVLVANDTVQNFLFHNRGGKRFDEFGALTGIAFDNAGAATGAMGVDAAWFRNDASLGLAIGNFSNEMTTLYVSTAGGMQFTDEAVASGLGPPTRLQLTFGVAFLDFDLDGRLDLLAANGHLEEDISKVQASQHYKQPPQLFWNAGPDEPNEFAALGEEHVGAELLKPLVGRGLAYADIDGDGDLDVVITASGAAPRLLRNDQQLGRHWLRVRLTGRGVNRDAIGAVVEATVDGRTMRRRVSPTRSYLSQVELPVTFGLDDAQSVERLTIRWPDGSVQELTDVAADQMLHVEQAK